MSTKLIPSGVTPDQQREADALLQAPSIYVDQCSIQMGTLVTRLTFSEAAALTTGAHVRTSVTMVTSEVIGLAKAILALAEKSVAFAATASAGTQGEKPN